MAADRTAREAKLSQYLIEAYGKEKELEVALEAHIGMTTRAPYKKRLKDHLKETKQHSRLLERRIKKVNGDAAATIAKAASQANKLVATAKGPLHALRGNSDTEKMLKNAKTEYFNEHEEIANYTAIEVLAGQLGDEDTAKVARQIRRDEERMAKFLEKQIPILTRQVVKEEIPAAERKPATKAPARRKSASASRTRAASGSSGSARSGSKSRAKSKAKK
jgi:ferritin-like metal-binding protein YciE